MRKIAVVLVDRANYGRMMPVMNALAEHPGLDLQLVCGGSMVLDRFRRPVDMVREDGFRVDAEVFHACEGSVPISTAKSIGHGVAEYANEFERLDPDFVMLIGDRHEALAAAVAAAYTRRCIVHLQGGEVSGTLDENARHAITKLAHYHAPATQQARANLIQMGEHPDTIISVGCPSSDMAATVNGNPAGSDVVVVFHPNTADGESIMPVLGAISGLPHRLVVFWPNIDAGSNAIHKNIRRWAHPAMKTVEFITNEHPRCYLQRLADAGCCVGNSSSFVRDAGYFGTPVVLVGDRQAGRECGEHVLPSAVDSGEIEAIARHQLAHGPYPPSALYGDGHVSGRIAMALAEVKPYTQKRLCVAQIHEGAMQ